ncbi:MAG: ABC transporter permease [Desulfobacteraceae bacterium]|nr:MAG: ABC transporter permease [Desulfobacteraceae bacterium]
MTRFILKRLLETIFVLYLALTAVFVMVRLSGDPVLLMVPADATPEFIEQFRKEMGFDRPLIVQYAAYIGGAVRGDFGRSLRQQAGAISLVLERVPASLLLTAAAIFPAVCVALPIGILSARRRGGIIDRLGTILAVLGQSVPNFWLGLMLILCFSVMLRWVPTGGMGTWRHLILPAVTLAAYSLARITRLTRSSMIEVLQSDYIRTAKAKGLGEGKILLKHAFKNAAIPIITITGLQIGVIFGGAVITETIFSWPGLGRLVVQSISFRDYPTVQASIFVIAGMICLINLAVDILYAMVNPEIRLEKTIG